MLFAQNLEFRAPLAVLSAPGTLTATLIAELKVQKLRAELHARRLPTGGLKPALANACWLKNLDENRSA